MSASTTVVAPIDPALPLLAVALDPVRAAEAIAESKHFVGTRVDVEHVELSRHKVGRRAVLAYRLRVTRRDGRLDVIDAVGKMRARPPRSAFRLLRTLWKAGFADDSADGISVPEPLASVPALGVWLQRRVPGRLATDLLTTDVAQPLGRRIAEAARKLHQAGVPPQRTHSLDDELAILCRVLGETRARLPKLASSIDALLRQCHALELGVDGPTAGIHRDFYADQVIVDGSRVYLLDFDCYCTGPTALDVGNFAGHLIEQQLRAPEHATALVEAREALVARFLEDADAGARRAVGAYTVLTLARHVYLSTVVPGRAHLTEAVLDCARGLAEVPHHGLA